MLGDGRKVTADLCRRLFAEQTEKLRQMVGQEQFARGNYELARDLIEGIVTKDEFTTFMTLVGYEHLDGRPG